MADKDCLTESERKLLEYLVAADGPGLIELINYDTMKGEVDAFVAESGRLRDAVRRERALPEDSQRIWDIGMEKADAVSAVRAAPYSEKSILGFQEADAEYRRKLEEMRAEVGEARYINAREVYYARVKEHGPRLKNVYGPGWYDDQSDVVGTQDG